MIAEKFVTVGIAGHVDHGKTSLVRCLTGIDTDRLKEEKRRGLSIEPGIAPLTLPSGKRIALVDVPGHSDFLKNTIRGLSGVDLAVLVVAADDGVMPQTRDHLEVLNFLKAKGGFTVLGKADLVDDETLELAEMEVRDVLEGSFLQGKPVVPFSAVNAAGTDRILQVMETEVDRATGKLSHAPFRLWIDQVRSYSGFGTVVSGTVLSGTIMRDDTVVLLPSGKETKVRFIEVHHQRVEHAAAGQRVGLNLQNLALQDVSLGNALAAPGLLHPSNLLNAELSLLPTARRPMVNHQRIKLYIGTCCVVAQVVMMETGRILPGETGLVQFRLQGALAVLPKDPFVVSPLNLHSVIGGGKILEAPREKFRAAKAEKTLEYLKPLQGDDVKAIINLYFGKFPSRPVTVEEIVFSTGFSVDKVQSAINSRVRSGKLLDLESRGYFEAGRYESLKTRLMQVTKTILSKGTFRTAAGAEEIRFRLDPNLDDVPFERMLRELCAEGELTKHPEGYRIPGLVVKPSLQREKLVRSLDEFAKKQRFATFSAGTFWKAHGGDFSFREIEKILDHLHAKKKLIRLSDDRFITPEAIQEIQERVKELILRKGSLSVNDSRQILGYGRTRAIPVLDYLDSIGLTRRVGDERVLNVEDGFVMHVRT